MADAGQFLPVVLLSKPGCVQCMSTERLLTAQGTEFIKHDVTESEQAEARVRELGYSALPVMDIPFDREVFDAEGNRVQHWYGFRPDFVKQLV